MGEEQKGDNGIIYAFAIDGTGHGKPLEGKAVGDMIEGEDLAWVHIDLTRPGGREWLEQNISYLDPIILDALLAEETRPRVAEYESGALMILRGVNLNEDAEPEDMVAIRLWVDEHRIISVRRRKLRAVQDIREKLAEGRGPKNAGDFVTMLASRLFERMGPVLTELDERVDDVEEKIIDSPDIGERAETVDIRKMAIMLRRYIAPQRDVIIHLRSSDQPWLDTTHKRRLQESLDHVTRYVEDLDMIRERAQIVKDELANILSDRLNRNMYILSVVAAIFLPLGFLTGLLGINVGGIPGAEYGQAFLIFCGLLACIVVLQILLFKKMKWF